MRRDNDRCVGPLCLTIPIDPISASATRAGLLSLLALLVLGLSVVALPGLLSEDAPDTRTQQQPENAAGLSNDDPGDPTESEGTSDSLPPEAPASDADSSEPISSVSLSVTARISADGIVLDGMVATEGQRDALVDVARRRVGPALVEDRLEVVTGLRSSAGRDNGVVALQGFISAVPDGVIVAAESSADRLVVSGEATDATGMAAIERALNTAIAGSPGMVGQNAVSVPPPPPPTVEELRAAAQVQLTNLNTLLAAEVLFATSSNEPTAEFKALLDRIPELLESHPSVTVEVVGHTDDRGSEGGNQDLSEERAGAALSYLVGNGVAPARLSSRGAGESEPIAPNSTRDGRAANRRVELVAL